MPAKTIRHIIIFTEIIFVVWVLYGLISRRPTDPVYWIAFAIEVGLGFLTYQVYKRYLTNRNYKQWNLLGSLLGIIGLAAPIIFYNTIDYLKPAGSTWLVFLLTVNSFYLYRVIKKQPMAREDAPPVKYFKATRVLHWIMFSLTVIMLIVVIVLAIIGNTPIMGEKQVNQAAALFVGILFLFLGFWIPGIAKALWMGEKSEFYVYMIYILRASTFSAVAALSLIMGIIDGLFIGSLPIVLMGGIAMYFTVPDEKGWNKYLGEPEQLS